MDELLSADRWFAGLQQLLAWLEANVFTYASLAQLLTMAGCFGLATWFGPSLKTHLLQRQQQHAQSAYLAPLAGNLARDSVPVLTLAMMGVSLLIARQVDWPYRVLVVFSSLMLAWILIRLLSNVVRDEFWSKVIATTAWFVAALNILGLLRPTIEVLDTLAFHAGTVRISAFGVVKALLSLVILLWGAVVVSDLLEQRLRSSRNINASVQVLLGKITRVLIVAAALLLALSSLGIDLTAFAVFGGAIGVGIGFGLQKIFSNLVSGVILLLDKSIKPGDVIGVAGYYGRVNSLGARYVSVITRDGIEYLIPNEDIITQQVENWSHSHEKVRLRLPVGVHYGSDVRMAIRLCLDAARETPRVLDDPAPVCPLRGFGDSSVDLEIRFWIADPMSGRANVCSEILLRVWEKFREHGVEIPYPQRDIHIRTAAGSGPALPGIEPPDAAASG